MSFFFKSIILLTFNYKSSAVLYSIGDCIISNKTTAKQIVRLKSWDLCTIISFNINPISIISFVRILNE